MRFITVLTLALFSFSSFAAEVDKSATEFKWTGSKVKGKHYGKVPLKSYSLDEKKAKKGKATIEGGEFVLDLTAFTVEDLSGKWAKKFLTHMKSADFFEVSKWPTAKIKINKLDGKKAYGKLTIKDKTHDVVIPYTQKGKTYSGTLEFDRTKYGMIYGSGNFFKNLGDKMISNEVKVDFKVSLK